MRPKPSCLPRSGSSSASRLELFLAGIVCISPFFAARLAAQEKPRFTIEEECTSFSFGPDSRIAIAVRHPFKVKKYFLERADIWMANPDGKKSRILTSEKMVK